MQQYGFKWPATLSCEQLPRISEQQTTGNICAAPPDTPDPSVLDPVEVSAVCLFSRLGKPTCYQITCYAFCIISNVPVATHL
ncbi:unnamed protein product [Gongylonema pulchrum]|uniref:Uncharacterized protein n=1 Tax=Gongylonema pulchrum TaxID=637853 RepID=A0A183DF37_9BILA|nr:unnamed protein product [Gongylonema pulchrum]